MCLLTGRSSSLRSAAKAYLCLKHFSAHVSLQISKCVIYISRSIIVCNFILLQYLCLRKLPIYNNFNCIIIIITFSGIFVNITVLKKHSEIQIHPLAST